MGVEADWVSTRYKNIGVFCCSYGTGTSKWVEVKVPKPACVYFPMTSVCDYVCYLLLYILICILLYSVLGFDGLISCSFHVYRKAPGPRYWKWFWCCLLAPLIVPTMISMSCFPTVFQDSRLIALVAFGASSDLSPFGIRLNNGCLVAMMRHCRFCLVLHCFQFVAFLCIFSLYSLNPICFDFY